MGNDGGSIPDRRDLVRSKPKAEQADKANQTRARWFSCALSKRPLQEPIVACALGKLYNKDAIIEFLLDRSAYGDGADICGHVRSLKDIKTLKLTPNTAPASASPDSATDRAKFVCPLTLKEMTGHVPFVYLSTCGCVFSQAGLKTVSSSTPPNEKEPTLDKEEADVEAPKQQLDICPQCAAKYDKMQDVFIINPSSEEEERMRMAMERRRALDASKPKSKKRKHTSSKGDGAAPEPPSKKKPSTEGSSVSAHIAATSRAVASSLAMEEAKRKANMSDAVKSLYAPKDGIKRKETFMTMGTFTRYA
ncbi:hypothetical protein HETIRDRAFT_479539 [Heterobasidion irregulare TC 32-1]|uniref:Uncharacterized protein n=1 Tax=Heterobasidion irregulare (strain TC 32-1) TaxID=747525 RepID=W4JZ83_HETIT|nr:uncharacterized protein HETIRDRAFT_479539 [Heterobasidion irregulare TC 32-1]ETW78390.1 hypothetical protein HETIRDRAFT_479539 [Heterobasidion irregulare TC 32-1]